MARDWRGLAGAPGLPDPWEALAVEVGRMQQDRGRASRELAARRLSFEEWTRLVPEPGGRSIDLGGRFAFQRALYSEESATVREQVLMKATQLGISSAIAVRLGLYWCDVHQANVLVCMPSEKDMRDFSRHRVQPVIEASQHLQGRMAPKAVASVSMRQIGVDGFWFGRGLAHEVLSLPIDLMIVDEMDSAPQEMLEVSERRVSGLLSEGMIRKIGVPSVPGYGVASAYEASDQRVWHVRCDACGDWNPLFGYEAFAANVDTENLELVCRSPGCRRAIDVTSGEWVAAFPDRDVAGFHLPRLLTPSPRILRSMVDNSRKVRPDEVERFRTHDLGEPFVSSENRLSIEQIRACVDESVRPSSGESGPLTPIVAGIDVASARALNVVIGRMTDDNHDQRLFVGEVEDGPAGTAFEQLLRLMNDYAVTLAVIDSRPEGRFASAFADALPGRVWRVAYFRFGPTQRAPEAAWRPNKQARFVSVERTYAIEATLERFRSRQVILPPLHLLPADYPRHLGSAVRRVADDRVRVDFVSTGPDDYLHAETYLLVARELLFLGEGVHLLALQQARPLNDQLDFERVNLSDYDAEPEYRPGFEDLG